jgi:hypothetical protein
MHYQKPVLAIRSQCFAAYRSWPSALPPDATGGCLPCSLHMQCNLDVVSNVAYPSIHPTTAKPIAPIQRNPTLHPPISPPTRIDATMTFATVANNGVQQAPRLHTRPFLTLGFAHCALCSRRNAVPIATYKYASDRPALRNTPGSAPAAWPFCCMPPAPWSSRRSLRRGGSQLRSLRSRGSQFLYPNGRPNKQLISRHGAHVT